MTIEQIKQECRKAIELSEKATKGPWESDWERQEDHSRSYYVEDEKGNRICDSLNSTQCIETEMDEDGADSWDETGRSNLLHIAHARTFAPAAAKALLQAIDSLELLLRISDGLGVTPEVKEALDAICAQFEP